MRISAGFFLLVVWFSAVNGAQLLFVILGAAVAHEMGHWVTLRLFGAEVLGLRVGILGAVLEADCRHLSYGKEVIVVLAGPTANLLCAWLLSTFLDGMEVMIGAHLVLGMFNLLPLRPLDGGRALYLIVSWGLGPWTGDFVARWIGTIAALLLSVCLCWLMHQTGGSLWLLPATIGLLVAAGRECLGKECFL